MKTLSTLTPTLALAAALAAGTIAAPAVAAPKKEAAAAPALKLSPEFRKVAAPAQDALAKQNWDGAEPLVAQAEAAAKTDDEKYIATRFRLQLVQHRITAARAANPNAPGDETALAAPLDALIANPSTPAVEKGNFLYVRGNMSYNGKQWAQAVQYLTQARAVGYQDPDLDLRLSNAKFAAGDVAGGSAELDTAIAKAKAAGKPAPEDYYKVGLARSLKAKDKALTTGWLNKWVAAYPNPTTWHDVLVVYGLNGAAGVETLDKNQRVDLFRLMHDTKSLADQSLYEQYAQDVIDRGLPNEALTVIKEGQANGKLTGSRAVTEELAAANNSARQEGPLAPLEAKAKTAADGKLAAQTADAYLGKGDNAKAAELYRLALSKGGVNTDEVNTHLGIALSRSGDKAGATAAFALVKSTPRAGLAGLWTTWVSQQS